MIWKHLKLTFLGLLILCLSNCGHDQQLVSIQVQPSTETFGAANIPVSANQGASVHLSALGTYIHPPVTKDITSQVTWSSNSPDMITVDPSGIITATGKACGNALIKATLVTNHSTGGISSSGALVTGSMTANVICFTGGPVLSAIITGAGSGTVTSSPSGLNCTSSCSASFTSGVSVTLTATPAGGSTFGGWMNCDSVSGLTCTLNNVTSDRTATVTFN